MYFYTLPVANIRQVADIPVASTEMVLKFRENRRENRYDPGAVHEVLNEVLHMNLDRFEEMKSLPGVRKPVSPEEVKLHVKTAEMMAELDGANTKDPFVLIPVFSGYWKACRAITTGDARPVKPYAPHRSFPPKHVSLSGQVGFVPGTAELAGPGVGVQTCQTMRNIGATLKDAGSSWALVDGVFVALRDMRDYPSFNAAYAAYLDPDKDFPTRTCVEAKPPMNARVEITVIQAGVRA